MALLFPRGPPLFPDVPPSSLAGLICATSPAASGKGSPSDAVCLYSLACALWIGHKRLRRGHGAGERGYNWPAASAKLDRHGGGNPAIWGSVTPTMGPGSGGLVALAAGGLHPALAESCGRASVLPGCSSPREQRTQPGRMNAARSLHRAAVARGMRWTCLIALVLPRSRALRRLPPVPRLGPRGCLPTFPAPRRLLRLRSPPSSCP